MISTVRQAFLSAELDERQLIPLLLDAGPCSGMGMRVNKASTPSPSSLYWMGCTSKPRMCSAVAQFRRDNSDGSRAASFTTKAWPVAATRPIFPTPSGMRWNSSSSRDQSALRSAWGRPALATR